MFFPENGFLCNSNGKWSPCVKHAAFILLRDNLCVPFHLHQAGLIHRWDFIHKYMACVSAWEENSPKNNEVLSAFPEAGPKSKLCHDLIHYLVIFNALA